MNDDYDKVLRGLSAALAAMKPAIEALTALEVLKPIPPRVIRNLRWQAQLGPRRARRRIQIVGMLKRVPSLEFQRYMDSGA